MADSDIMMDGAGFSETWNPRKRQATGTATLTVVGQEVAFAASTALSSLAAPPESAAGGIGARDTCGAGAR